MERKEQSNTDTMAAGHGELAGVLISSRSLTGRCMRAFIQYA
jgi:hypothetical protein